MLEDSFGHAEEDMKLRELREQKVEAARLLESIYSALSSDADLLNEAEQRSDRRHDSTSRDGSRAR